MKLSHIIFNRKYSSGSLYGFGVFPFWLYIAFFGKPIYKLSRKIGLNQFFSLMMANILGSVFHVNFFSSGLYDIPAFIISLFTMASVFWLFNNNRMLTVLPIGALGVFLWTHATEYTIKLVDIFC